MTTNVTTMRAKNECDEKHPRIPIIHIATGNPSKMNDALITTIAEDMQIVFVTRIGEVVDAALELLVAQPPPPLPVVSERQSGVDQAVEPISVKGK